MKPYHLTCLAVALGGVLLSPLMADDALPTTVLAQRGKLLLSEDFSAMPKDVSMGGALTSLKHGWRFKPGKWEVVDGALRGAQVEADHHSAGAFGALVYKDAVIQFDVRLDGAKQVLFCVDDGGAQRAPTATRPAQLSVEHICRVIINKDGFSAQKDDADHDGPDKAVPFGAVKMAIKPGEWKTVVLEVRGEKMAATIDGQTITGSHPLIASDKGYFSLNVTGETGCFRRLRIWEAGAKE